MPPISSNGMRLPETCNEQIQFNAVCGWSEVKWIEWTYILNISLVAGFNESADPLLQIANIVPDLIDFTNEESSHKITKMHTDCQISPYNLNLTFTVQIAYPCVGGPGRPCSAGYQRIHFREVGLCDGITEVVVSNHSRQFIAESLKIITCHNLIVLQNGISHKNFAYFQIDNNVQTCWCM